MITWHDITWMPTSPYIINNQARRYSLAFDWWHTPQVGERLADILNIACHAHTSSTHTTYHQTHQVHTWVSSIAYLDGGMTQWDDALQNDWLKSFMERSTSVSVRAKRFISQKLTRHNNMVMNHRRLRARNDRITTRCRRLQSSIGRLSSRIGTTATSRLCNLSQHVVRYWKRKWNNPNLHAGLYYIS